MSPQTRKTTSLTPTPINELVFQAFEWHTPSNPPAPDATHSSSSHWTHLTRLLPSLAADLGVSAIWLPPGCKANNPAGNGYDCYDLWDLGEFDQKWARSTKWGSREELADLINVASQCGREDARKEGDRGPPGSGVRVIWDAVLNHKTAGDATQETWTVEVDGQDRRLETTPPRLIEAWLRFEFPARARAGMPYSSLQWSAEHFNGTDWDQRAQKNAIYKLIDPPDTTPHLPPQPSPKWPRLTDALNKRPSSTPTPRPGKGWAADVDHTFGNFDYLMFSNIDYTHAAVRADVLNWGKWMIESTGVAGFRLDAAQHFSWNFTRDWIRTVGETYLSHHQQHRTAKPLLIIGEVLAAETQRITRWLDAVGPSTPSPALQLYAIDAPLLYTFSSLSQMPSPDLHHLLPSSSSTNPNPPLIHLRPSNALTFITSHDTQPGQTSHTPISAFLKPLLYAFILLRTEGLPCVFYGDLYGTHGPHAEGPACLVPTHPTAAGSPTPSTPRSILPALMRARKLFAYGAQRDWAQPRDSSVLGWTRAGTWDRSGCVVVLSARGGGRGGSSAASEGRGMWGLKGKGKGESGQKRAEGTQVRMCVAGGLEGSRWVDLMRGGEGEGGEGRATVVLEKGGWGDFRCDAQVGVAVYVLEKNLQGLSGFPVCGGEW